MIRRYFQLCNCHLASGLRAGNVSVIQHRSASTSAMGKEVPVIRIPKYLEKGLGNAVFKEHRKVKETFAKRNKVKLNPKHANKLIISWTGDKKLNHYYGFRYNPDRVPLISKDWIKQASIGHRMTIHSFDDNPSLLESTSGLDKSFTSLGLNENLISSIYRIVNKGAPINPSSVQFGVIPSILQNKNVIFSAETGSGKTIAYLAPIIQLIEEQKKLNATGDASRSPYGLVVLPSRELTEQVGHVAKELASLTNVGVATMIGGVPKNITHTGLDLVVTTIGMVESHINRGIYRLNRLHHIVLDEADTLLDDTFSYEVVDLLENLNINSANNAEVLQSDDEGNVNMNGTQLICASATMPTTLDSTIGGLVNLNEDVERVTTKHLHNLHANVKHVFYRLGKYEKDLKLIELLKEDVKKGRPTIIFANRTDAANWLFFYLNENDIRCVRLTAGMTEEERFHSFRSFQNGEYDILVSTDLGSRGLDTTRVHHVINFDCPHYVSDYIHRAGRVGRLGSTMGSHLVSTFVSFKPDAFMVMELEKAVRLGVEIECTNANIKAQISQRRADKKNKIERNFS